MGVTRAGGVAGGGLGGQHPSHAGLKGYGERKSALDTEPGQRTPAWARGFIVYTVGS